MDVITVEAVQILLTKIIVFTPITTGLVQAVKVSGYVSERFLPLAAIAIGCMFGWFFVAPGALGIFGGIALGLAAVGLFEFGKTTVAGN